LNSPPPLFSFIFPLSIPGQIKKLQHSKGNNGVNRQPTEWEKTHTNDLSDRGLIPEIYKELERARCDSSHL
jgi:hypothetical protein